MTRGSGQTRGTEEPAALAPPSRSDRFRQLAAQFPYLPSEAIRRLADQEAVGREAGIKRLSSLKAQRERSGEDMAELRHLTLAMLARYGFDREELDRFYELREGWPELSGPQWSSHSRPKWLRKGELVVEATNRRMVPSLRNDAGQLRKRINQRLGRSLIVSVRVVGPPWRVGD